MFSQSLQARARAELELRKRHGENRARGKFARFAAYQNNPVGYAFDVLGATLWSTQQQIANSVRDNRRTAVKAGHAVGKTFLLGTVTQWHFDCFQPSITLNTAPNWEAVHDLLWQAIRAQRQPGMPGRLLEMMLDGGPQHYAKGHNAETSTGFQGRHEGRQLIIIDEAMGVGDHIWQGTNAMMVTEGCRTLAVGNPTQTSGEFYDIQTDPDWVHFRISCLDHPNILAELAGLPAPFPKAVRLVWVQEMLRKHCSRTTQPTGDAFEFPVGSGEWYTPDDIFRSRVLGLFPKQASTAVWSEEWLDIARTSTLTWTPRDIAELGVDIARFGDDKTTIYARRGPVVLFRESYVKQDTMATAGRVIKAAERLAGEQGIGVHDIGLNVDDTGLGGGVTDRLREEGYRVNAAIFGARARDPEEYTDRGSELWLEAAELGSDRKLNLSALPDDVYRVLAAELRARQYKIHGNARRKVESKDDLKKRIRRSPDDADAFCLAFAGGVRAPSELLTEIAKPAVSRFVKPATTPSERTGSRWRR